MNHLPIVVVVLASLIIAGCETGDEGGAVDERAQAAVEVRQSLLTLLKSNFGPLVGIARDQIPYDAPYVQKNAMRMQQLAAMMADAFSRDTRGTGVETEALDRIWEEPALFADKIATLESRIETLRARARGDDPAAVKAAIGDVGKACGSCHDDFRVDDD